MFTDTWYTLFRFLGTPEHLTAVAQTKTATEAHALIGDWTGQWPDETSLVFDTANHPVEPSLLVATASTSGH